MNDPTPFLRLYALPIWLAATAVGALLFEMWAVAMISGVAALNLVYAQKDEYPRGVKGGGQPQRTTKSWSDPDRLGLGLLSSGAVIIVGVLGFGFSIGVIAAMAMWAIILAFWVRALLRRSRAS